MVERPLKVALIVALALLTGPVVAEDQAAHDKRDVETLIRHMFTKKIRNLERVISREPTPFLTRCDYLRLVFDTSLLDGGDHCRPVWGNNFRFPGLSAEDLMYLDEANELPKSRIIDSSVKGTVAVVKVQAPIGDDMTPTRIVYFLRKADGHWRIYNMLAYEHWPLDTNREGGCKDVSGYYHFALPPRSEADLEDLPPACRPLELHEIRQRTRGK